MERAWADDAVALLTDDGTEVTIQLARALAQRGLRVVLLRGAAMTHKAPEPVTVMKIDAVSDEAMRDTVRRVQEVGTIQLFVHLHPVVANPDRIPAVFWLAKHLQPVFRASPHYGSFLVSMRINGALGYGATAPFDWRAAGLSGLVKSLNREWAAVLCRTVDLHPQLAPDQVVDCLLAELHDTDLARGEVGYDANGKRVAPVTEPMAPVSGTPSAVRSSDVLLVTGGARGITAECVIARARTQPGTFILMGHTPQHPEPEWARGITDEKALKQRIFRSLSPSGDQPRPVEVQNIYRQITVSRSIQATLTAVRQQGGQAVYVVADITDAEVLREKLSALQAEHGPITGVIHGAGALADKRIEKKTEADLAKVYDTKVQGLLNIMDALDASVLRQIVLFSSVVGFHGNQGQTDYALANDTLNKWALSYQAQNPDTKVVAINWGPWKTGMVTEYTQQAFEKQGITIILPEEGTTHFCALLSPEAREGVVIVNNHFPAPQKALPPPSQPLQLRKTVKPEENPFLADHVIGGYPVMPFVTGIAWITNAAEQLFPAYRLVESQQSTLFNGIIFNGKQADAYTLDLAVTEQDAHHVRLRGKVRSQDARGRPRYHYGSEVLLLASVPEAPTYPIPEFADEPLQTRAALYAEGSLFHGPTYQGIEALWRMNEWELWYTCRLPEPDERTPGQFPLLTSKTFATDAMCQGFLVWAFHHLGTSCLPARLGQMTIYEPLPFDETFWVHLRITEQQGHKITGDVTAIRATGRVLVDAQDVTLTASPELLSLYRTPRPPAPVPLAVVDMDIQLPGVPNLDAFHRHIYDGTLPPLPAEQGAAPPTPPRPLRVEVASDYLTVVIGKASPGEASPTATATTLPEALEAARRWLAEQPTGSVIIRAAHEPSGSEAAICLQRASEAHAADRAGYAVLTEEVSTLEPILPTVEYLDVATTAPDQLPAARPDEPGAAPARCALGLLPWPDGPFREVARLMKATLCLHRRFLPAFTEPQRIPEGELPYCYAPEYSFAWIPENPEEKRVAALNFTDNRSARWLVLHEAVPPAPPSPAYLRSQGRKLLLVSGDDEAALQTALTTLADESGAFSHSWAEAQYRQYQSTARKYTVSLVAGSADQLVREVSSAQKGVAAAFAGQKTWQTPAGSYFTAEPLGATARVGFVYPGLASSYGGMMKDYLQLFPQHLDYYRAQTDQLHELVHHPLVHPRYLQRPDPAGRQAQQARFLNNTVAAAESSISMSVLVTRVLRQDFGLQPQAALGYSMGGITMLFAAEVWGFGHLHSRVQQSPVFQADPAYQHWAHWVLKAPAERVRQQLSEVNDLYLTFVNTPENVIISGDRSVGEAWLRHHRHEGMRVELHNVAHCPPVRALHEDLRQMHQLDVEQTSGIQFYSGVTNQVLRLDKASLAKNAADTYCQPVDFVSLVRKTYQDGINVFIEVGPQAWCAGLVGDILQDQPHVSLSVDRKGTSDYHSLLKLSSVLRSHGVPIRLPFYESSLAAPPPASVAEPITGSTGEALARSEAVVPEAPVAASSNPALVRPEEGESVLHDLDRACYLHRDEDSRYYLSSDQAPPDQYQLTGILPPLPAHQLGSAAFRAAHGLRYAYMAGAMANGIASEAMVIALGQQGFLGSFGAAGLRVERIEEAIQRIQEALPQGPYAFNLIHTPGDSSLEMRLVEMYLRYRVPTLEASAFMELTPALVYYRVAGLREEGGAVRAHNKIIAKVSRPEVAQRFMRPAPEALLDMLVQQGKITDQQRQWAQSFPMADDITVEADSGGHTDRQPLVGALPEMIRLRERVQQQHAYAQPLRIGAAGGISTPASVTAALALGADYVVTGSINQACQEAGTSPKVKSLLAQATSVDVGLAPSSDMFEMGVSVQVLKRGTLYVNRAQKLFRYYQQYESLDDIPANERAKLEKQLFQKSVDEVWSDVEDFFSQHEPHKLAAARQHPKKKMALVFRWYLGLSSKWAVQGTKERTMDYQVWCGPSMGSFNDWVKGSPMEALEHRKVAEVARRLLQEAAQQQRQQLLDQYRLPPQQAVFTPNETLAYA